jgi:hypothetical protein
MGSSRVCPIIAAAMPQHAGVPIPSSGMLLHVLPMEYSMDGHRGFRSDACSDALCSQLKPAKPTPAPAKRVFGLP